jgi:AAA domain-containing protein
LAEAFAAGQRVAVVCAVTGARGVGKTQLAAAYARQQAAAGCPLVAWVSAETTDVLVADLARVARAVGAADPDGGSVTSALRLRDYLQARQDRALLVIDNAVDADVVRRFVPGTGATAVIVTSTDHALAQLGTAVEVSVFDRDQSLTYLHARTGLNDREGAGRVAEELGDLPLALAQAASVIQVHCISYPDYLSRLASLPVSEVLTRRRGDPYPKGAAEAILLSLRAAEDTDESGLTTRLLAVIAVLSPTGVQRAVLPEILRVGDGDGAGPVVRAGRAVRRWVSVRLARPTGTAVGGASVDETLARLVGLSLPGRDVGHPASAGWACRAGPTPGRGCSGEHHPRHRGGAAVPADPGRPGVGSPGAGGRTGRPCTRGLGHRAAPHRRGPAHHRPG